MGACGDVRRDHGIVYVPWTLDFAEGSFWGDENSVIIAGHGRGEGSDDGQSDELNDMCGPLMDCVREWHCRLLDNENRKGVKLVELGDVMEEWHEGE